MNSRPAPVGARDVLAPVDDGEPADAPGAMASRPRLIASRTSARIAVIAWAAQHHCPAGAASVTACTSRRACAQHNW